MYWFQCSNAVQAPLNDIKILKDLRNYKNTDKVIADAAISKFINHLYYLNEKCACFCLIP